MDNTQTNPSIYNAAERDKVARAFYADGQLLALPAKRKKRFYILSDFVRLFDLDKDYPEQEINQRIEAVFEDYCTIRRELVDFGFMARDAQGYRRLQADDWLPEI